MARRQSMRLEMMSPEDSEGDLTSDWMTTFSDMSTLLMTFFIILATMIALKIDPSWLAGKDFIVSQVREESPDQVSVTEVPPEMQEKVKMLATLPAAQLRELIQIERIQEIGQSVQDYLIEAELDDFVDVDITRWKVTIVPLAPVLFASGKATLRAQGKELLARLAEFLEISDVRVRISGHTDDRPIRTERFPSNWELSSARATAVMRYFVEEHGASPSRFSAVGYGPYRPVADNSTPADRARNRRVEIEFIQRVDASEGELLPAPLPPVAVD